MSHSDDERDGARQRLPGEMPDSRWIYVYLNGDEHFPPMKTLVNQRHFRSLESLLERLTDRIRPSFGAVRNVYTPRHGHRVCGIDDLRTNGRYVAAGYEKFRQLPRGYPDVDQLGSLHRARKRAARANKIAGRKREALPLIHKINRFEAPITIFVHKNNSQREAPTRCLLLGRDRVNMERVLQVVGEKLGLDASYVKRLCLPEGDTVRDVDDVEHGGHYIALLPHEVFKKPSSKLPNNYTRTYDTFASSATGMSDANSGGYSLVDPETDVSFCHKPEDDLSPEHVAMKEASTSTADDMKAISEETQTTPKVSIATRTTAEVEREDRRSPDTPEDGRDTSDAREDQSEYKDDANEEKRDSDPGQSTAKRPPSLRGSSTNTDGNTGNSAPHDEVRKDSVMDTSQEVHDTGDRSSPRSAVRSAVSKSPTSSSVLRRDSIKGRVPSTDFDPAAQSHTMIERAGRDSARETDMVPSVRSNHFNNRSPESTQNYVPPNGKKSTSTSRSLSTEQRDKASLASFSSVSETEQNGKRPESEIKQNSSPSTSHVSNRSVSYAAQDTNSDDYIEEKHLSHVLNLSGVPAQEYYRPNEFSERRTSNLSFRRESVTSIRSSGSVISRREEVCSNDSSSAVEKSHAGSVTRRPGVGAQRTAETGQDYGHVHERTNEGDATVHRRRLLNQSPNRFSTQQGSRNSSSQRHAKASSLHSAASRDIAIEVTPKRRLQRGDSSLRQKYVDEARTASVSRASNPVVKKKTDGIRTRSGMQDENAVRSRASSVDSLRSNKDSGYSPASISSKDSSEAPQQRVKDGKEREVKEKKLRDNLGTYCRASPPHSPIRTYAYLVNPNPDTWYEFSENVQGDQGNGAPLRYSLTGRSQWKPDTYPILEEEDVFYARSSLGRNPGRPYKQVDLDEDTGGVFRAKHRFTDFGLASEVQESKDTQVDLPLDQVEPQEVDEECLTQRRMDGTPSGGPGRVSFLPSGGNSRCGTSSDRGSVGHFLACDGVQRMIL